MNLSENSEDKTTASEVHPQSNVANSENVRTAKPDEVGRAWVGLEADALHVPQVILWACITSHPH